MSVLKKVLIGVLILLGVSALAIAIIAFSFAQAMKSDPDEEKRVKDAAEQYIIEHFADEVTAFDTLFDGMGNFDGFEYAAVARHEKSGTDFLIYHDDYTGQMTDTFIISKWEDEAEASIKPYVEERLGEALTRQDSAPIIDSDDWDEIEKQMKGKIEIFVYFDEQAVEEANVDVNNPVSYNEAGVNPSLIRIDLPRKKQADDDQVFNDLIDSLQADGVVNRGTLRVEYIDMGVPLEEENWENTF
ncbi:hypothetical protein IEO70_16505 [Bacillus sp. AGMB 02131]|uniref:Uncharacterized protein n=1 Tax=Peribacillus faecalis TaxID=2772559 RepID=A0A927HCS3_9BACI|nr:hypothetical protein [Peribacillus faecalis]MBD3109942.1 hypothetical protein [Peribacillus faecalis]